MNSSMSRIVNGVQTDAQTFLTKLPFIVKYLGCSGSFIGYGKDKSNNEYYGWVVVAEHCGCPRLSCVGLCGKMDVGGCYCDVNNDGYVNIIDIIYTVNHIIKVQDYDVNMDLNSDNIISILDIIMLVNLIID